MQEKKSAKANLENYRPIFFLIGLILSMSSLLYVLEIKVAYTEPEIPQSKIDIVEAGFPIPLTYPEKLEKPEPKAKEPEPTKPIKLEQRFKIVDNNTKIDSRPTIDVSTLIPVTDEPTDPIAVEIIDAVLVQNMARPIECESVTDKSEQLDCFNRWISRYLAEETEYPSRPRNLGVEERMFLQFLISETGMVEEVEVLRGEDQDLRKEAMRVLKSMPQFSPASQMGKPVKVRVIVPVNFKLQ
jgi:protein TonB